MKGLRWRGWLQLCTLSGRPRLICKFNRAWTINAEGTGNLFDPGEQDPTMSQGIANNRANQADMEDAAGADPRDDFGIIS